MTRRSIGRFAVLLGLLLAPGAVARLDAAEGERSLHEIERTGAPRVISFEATSREPGGEFVLRRVDSSARELARFKTLPGTHRYRFLDLDTEGTGQPVAYFLEYRAPSGIVSLLHEAIVARRALRESAAWSAPMPIPMDLLPVRVDALMRARGFDAAPVDSPIPAPPNAPEPPPPRT